MTASTDLDDTLANIRARAEAATPGPWRASGLGTWVGFDDKARFFRMFERSAWGTSADAEFIAHARADVELLLNVVAEQRAVIARVRDWLAAHPTTHDVRQTEGYWRAQHDLSAQFDGADTTTTDGAAVHKGDTHA